MALFDEIQTARTEVASDGYEMSVGEILNLYRDQEIIINPDFQRLFRWDIERKSRFLESLLLGIPTPPIFVYQDPNGKWELIDGLQRLSTILEFVGILRRSGPDLYEPSVLEGTKFLPSLAGKRWVESTEGADDGIGDVLQLQIKRARLRVEILKSESDPKAKFELFQRLNTGGAALSPQEVRNCVAVMLDPEFYKWLQQCADFPPFKQTVDQTEVASQKQSEIELALRFFSFRNVPYQPGLNVHEYLDESLITIASSSNFNRDTEIDVFHRTFTLLNSTMGPDSFKRWDGSRFTGKFLMSVFEVAATGISWNIEGLEQKEQAEPGFVRAKCQALWQNEVFVQNNGAGIRGTTRLSNLLPMAKEFFSIR